MQNCQKLWADIGRACQSSLVSRLGQWNRESQVENFWYWSNRTRHQPARHHLTVNPLPLSAQSCAFVQHSARAVPQVSNTITCGQAVVYTDVLDKENVCTALSRENRRLLNELTMLARMQCGDWLQWQQCTGRAMRCSNISWERSQKVSFCRSFGTRPQEQAHGPTLNKNSSSSKIQAILRVQYTS